MTSPAEFVIASTPDRPQKRVVRPKYGVRSVTSLIGIVLRHMRDPSCCALVVLALSIATPGVAFAEVRPADQVAGAPVGAGRAAKSAPDVGMPAGALVAPDGRVLWSREASDTRAIASVTKLMTAVVALDKLQLDDTLKVPPSATDVGQSGAGLRAGEQLSVREALEGALVKSGNDAALALALRASRNEAAFVKLMNAKAASLGLTNTRFANSYGLDEPGHYSTSADLATLSRYAMTYPAIREMVRKRTATIGRGERRRRLEASNKLLGTYAGANGIKTGWTSDAGYSVVASAKRGGVELVAVVLGARSESERFEEAAKLLDWGFARYRRRSIVTTGSVAGTAIVTDYDDVAVPVVASRSATAAVFAPDGPLEVTARYRSRIEAPVSRDDTLGVLVYSQKGRLLASVPLVAGDSVSAPTPAERLRIHIARWWKSIFD